MPPEPPEPSDVPIGALAASLVRERVAPAVVIAASVHLGTGWQRTVVPAGRLGFGEDEPEVNEETLFDLASVTKPVTALTAARLVKRGGLAYDERLGALLPETRACRAASATLDSLLAHRAGLEPHRPLYAPLCEGRPVDRRASMIEAADARRPDALEQAETYPPVYSDLGYLLAGAALVRAAGRPLDQLMQDELLGPLGIHALGCARGWRLRRPDYPAHVAPTELVGWRGGTVRGAVHDENAWALEGEGVAGNAGLFGTAGGVLDLGEAVLDRLVGRRSDVLTASDLLPLVRPRPGGTLRAGFDGKSAVGSSAGARFGPRSFGHLGFTGTSLWIDPDRALVGVLLTNRVHPTRANDRIRAARPRVYDALAVWGDGLRGARIGDSF